MRGDGGKAARRGRRAACAALALALAGCGAFGPPAEAVGPLGAASEAPWPRLVDAPAPGVDPDGPGAETGRAVALALTREALVSAVRAEALAGPVVPPGEAARLARAAGR
ncbi:MAG: hypothetical protein R6V44_12765 [Paracoccaceae bacterium]